MDESNIEKLAAGLRALRSYVNSESFDGHVCGICDLIAEFVLTSRHDNERWLRVQFSKWPEFSGDRVFPIPGYDDPAQAYVRANEHEMWSPEHPYGAARRRLLDFLIDRAEAGLDADLWEHNDD